MKLQKAEFIRKRRNDLQKILHPIVKTPPASVRLVPDVDRLTWIAGPSASEVSMIKSSVEDYHINFFEEWVEIDPDKYELKKLYLHVRKVTPHKITELLALHSDANELIKNKASRYKKAPHLHISSDGEFPSHAHISTCLGDLTGVCKSIEALTDAFKRITEMLALEVFPRLKA